ncbi:MAG TPA: carbohydrate ABC transporter permease [Kouleothrix sp.]|uniref:carbohydrate ABC transporter permease n=1 Tax=Kouleothrix sp. TaxID=2779161 RepID=UPI002BFF982E|nr:carbohydrate ABC transporter permease [Kouleothrix sp.]HRC74309.1 carbohydrate ABC transporter permease [Kouleothrix sp.]
MTTALEKQVSAPLAREHEQQPAPRGRLAGVDLAAWLVLASISALFLVPFLWMLSTSLKDFSELFNNRWLPTRLAWENYAQAFSFGQWPRWALNTVVIALASVLGTLLSTSLVAYAFARLRWPGRDWLFGLVLATMMLPGIVTLIPQYILFSKLPAFGFQGSDTWVNTFLPLVVPSFAGDAFYIFLLRQFMRTIPLDLSEAARIDGASELRTWWSVVLPLVRPALAYIAITKFQYAWEDFMGPLIYLQRENLYTLQLGLRQFEAAAGGAPAWNWLMAASLVVMLPVIVIFLLFQRYFIEGVTLSGMGGR